MHNYSSGAKIKIENLHYDLTEEDIRVRMFTTQDLAEANHTQELFNRMGQVSSVELLYDRQDRSKGIAYVSMPDPRDARDAVRDFDGANANGQPIRVSLVASAPVNKPRNPFDNAERPSRSLFDRVEKRSRSESPQTRPRRGDREERGGRGGNNIDSYVPGARSGSQRRSPPQGRRGGGNDGRRGSRRPGERQQRRPNTDTDGHKLVQGRPRKTQEELDAEMEDYFGKNKTEPASTGQAAAPVTAADGDVDMIE
jgi:THO complex subunit 4